MIIKLILNRLYNLGTTQDKTTESATFVQDLVKYFSAS